MYSYRTMALWKVGLLCLCVAATLPHVRCATVLSLISPGPLSHLFNMKKVAEAVAARGHTLKVFPLSTTQVLISRAGRICCRRWVALCDASVDFSATGDRP